MNNMKLRKVKAMFYIFSCTLSYVLIVLFFRLKNVYVSLLFLHSILSSILGAKPCLMCFFNLIYFALY